MPDAVKENTNTAVESVDPDLGYKVPESIPGTVEERYGYLREYSPPGASFFDRVKPPLEDNDPSLKVSTIQELDDRNRKRTTYEPEPVRKELEASLDSFGKFADDEVSPAKARAASNVRVVIEGIHLVKDGEAYDTVLGKVYDSMTPADREKYVNLLQKALEYDEVVSEGKLKEDSGALFKKYYTDVVDNTKVAQNEELAKNSQRMEPQAVLRNSILSALDGPDKKAGSVEFVTRLFESGKSFMSDKDILNSLLQDAQKRGFGRDSLPSGLNAALTEFETKEFSPALLGRAMHLVLPENKQSVAKGVDYDRILGGLLVGVAPNKYSEVFAGFGLASTGKVLDEDAGFSHLSKTAKLSEIKLDKLESLRADAKNASDQNNADFEFIDADIVRRNLLSDNISDRQTAILALISAKDPAKYLEEQIVGNKAKIDIFIAEAPEDVREILEAVRFNDQIKIRAESIDWSIRNKAGDLYKVLMNTVTDNDLTKKIDEEHLLILTRRHGFNKDDLIDKGTGYIDYRKVFEAFKLEKKEIEQFE